VSATNKGTNAARSVITNDAGAYSFPSLAPGTYSLRAEKPGFKTVVRNEIELQVQQAARIDIELQVGQVNESIEVQGEAGALVTDNATVGTVIENRRIVELPLNGRNYLQLVSLAPNVSTGFAGQGQATARQGGIRAGQTISVQGAHTFNAHIGRHAEHDRISSLPAPLHRCVPRVYANRCPANCREVTTQRAHRSGAIGTTARSFRILP
jgi:hypothetical protein